MREPGTDYFKMRAILSCLLSASFALGHVASADQIEQRISLPQPEASGEISVEEALRRRRSVREFARGELNLRDVSQLLWAAQGVTARHGYRTAPSAGALYPLEIYVVAGNVEGLSPGVYRYRPAVHELILVVSDDRRKALARAALAQSWVRRTPAVIVLAAVYERTTRKYGKRGRRYVHIEVGHAAQNIYLQAVARDLGTVMVGAFDGEEVQDVLKLPDDHEPLGLMPVGKVR